MTIKFRKYQKNQPYIPKLLITGRVPSGWLMDNAHKISRNDFYNPLLSEDDLKKKYNMK